MPCEDRLASSDSGVGQVLEGREVDQEGKRRLHQGLQDACDLLHEAGSMTASALKRSTGDFSLTSAAGPYMTNSIRALTLHVKKHGIVTQNEPECVI
jgi:hypothetical protein